MVVMFLLPLLLILGFIIRLIRRSHAVKKYEEDLAAYRQNRKELEEKLADVENRILQDTKDTASVSDELNSTQTNFANAQLGQYHKLAERYSSLLKYRSLVPEQYHNPLAMSELVKIVTTMGADSWGEALELCDIKMMSGEGIPLTNDLYQQISRYFHNDKCVMHMISICENDAKMEALTETWKNNQRVNAEYLNYEKTLQAQAARSEGEVPIGAVVVARGRIIARGHNMTERLHDPTAHAEMIALTAATEALGGKYLQDCTLYVTVEPCPMCAGAIGWAQLPRIVYGAPDEKRGFREYAPHVMHPKAECIGGVLADECRQLMQEFFKAKR
jgi:tRNA(adenine34) deaminase